MINYQDKIDLTDFEKPKLSTGLNVLTILSIIGCVLQLGGALWQFYSAKKSFDEKDAMLEKMNSPEMPGFARKMMGNPEDYITTITKNFENRLPILILSLVAVALCFYGILQMRSLKKQGFLFYVIGEVLPFLTMFLFVGAFALSGFGFFIGAAFTLLFIALYAAQRKYLIY